MYLFILKTFDGSFDFRICKGILLTDAIKRLYDSIGAKPVTSEIFELITSGQVTEDVIRIFNALLPSYQIKAVYSGLYKMDIDGLEDEERAGAEDA